MPALVLLQSNTGNTRSFLEFLDKHSSQELYVSESFDVNPDVFDNIAIGSFTWGNGKIPARIKKFLIDNHKSLKGKNIFIFGSGFSIYPKFCGAVDGINKICSDSGANIKGIFKFEQRFKEEELLPLEKEELISLIKNWSAE